MNEGSANAPAGVDKLSCFADGYSPGNRTPAIFGVLSGVDYFCALNNLRRECSISAHKILLELT